jgi:L-amino acid N-acyltransferase YncA
MVSVNAACCTGLPHAADIVMGTLSSPPCCPEDLPDDVTTRPVTADDMAAVLAIYDEGLATRNATFETRLPTAEQLRERWLPGLAWVAELDGQVVGWTAITPVSTRECYAGVGESSVYVTEAARGRGVGKALLFTQVTEADKAGLWTLQTSIFPENRASLALHHSAGYRTLAVRTRIAKLEGVWRDTVLLERRNDSD